MTFYRMLVFQSLW